LNKKYSLLAGPLICALLTFLLQYCFGFKSALAIGTIIWMGLWWISRPVDIAVTALLPIGINAVFNLIPANQIINQYFSEIVVLLVGSDLISITWTNTGLDKRLAIKTLCFIGTSLKQQITVWLFVSTILSIFLPNVVVAMIMVPIAVSMLHFIGEKDIKTSKIAVPILLAIVWGSGIGGFGSPLGGSANLVAISYLENICGHEFMYIDWVSRFLPFLILTMLLNLAILLAIKLPVKKLANTKDYFNDMYKQLGPMSKGEKIGLGLFIISTVLAFARPLFAESLPALRPAYIFFICGLLTFVLEDEEGKVLLTWKQAEKELMWGMFFLFAGGLALGKMVTGTGAATKLAEVITVLPLSGGIETIFAFTMFSTILTEVSSNTAAASIAIPIIQSISEALGLNVIPYILVTIVAVNCAYILPVSTRAIPIGYGLEPSELFKHGVLLSVLNILLTTVLGYIFINYWSAFGQI
jgi:sodium-dependent dicarboxylate transporter 2/3/5